MEIIYADNTQISNRNRLLSASHFSKKYKNMTKKLKRHKGLIKIAIIMVPMLFGWLYRELRSTVIFHTPQERKYLGKVVCTVNEDLDKLYIENHVARYRLPYIWNWKEEDEAAFFIRNYADIIQKTDLDFWKLDVYLDENNFYLNHMKTEYCCGLRHILQSKINK